MEPNIFYSRTVKGRLKLLKRNGEFVNRIRSYGFYIDLYVLDSCYCEVYFNRYTDKLCEVEMLDAKDERLNQFAVQVNLSDLFDNRKTSK